MPRATKRSSTTRWLDQGDYEPVEPAIEPNEGPISIGERLARFSSQLSFSFLVGLLFSVMIAALFESLHAFDLWLVLSCVALVTLGASIVYGCVPDGGPSAAFIFFGGVAAIVGCLSAREVMDQWWYVQLGSVLNSYVPSTADLPSIHPYPSIFKFAPGASVDLAHAIDFHSHYNYNLPSMSWPVCVAPVLPRSPQPSAALNSTQPMVPRVWAYGERCCGFANSTAITCAGWHSDSIKEAVVLKDRFKGVTAVRHALELLNLPFEPPVLLMITDDAEALQRDRLAEGFFKIACFLAGYIALSLLILFLCRRMKVSR